MQTCDDVGDDDEDAADDDDADADADDADDDDDDDGIHYTFGVPDQFDFGYYFLDWDSLTKQLDFRHVRFFG